MQRLEQESPEGTELGHPWARDELKGAILFYRRES